VNRYRLLVDCEVVEQLNALPKAKRLIVRRALAKIAEFPDAASDFRETGPHGIRIDVHLAAGFAIKYWIDFADRHVKVLDLESADR